MAVNKAKVLKVADKYVVQGKISSAITEYQKLIKEDPTDLPLVNTLGDLYVRVGNVAEAVKCFARMAESYDNGGFIVRAIAMYKKVVKTDPTQISPLVRLADLYLRQGLVSEARNHFLQVADNYLKRGAFEEAAIILKKIIEADPDNPALEERLAEVYQQLNQNPEAAASFHSASIKLMRKGQFVQAEGCLKKAQELDSNNLAICTSHAEVLSELGRVNESLEILHKVPFADFNSEVLETGFKIYLRAGMLAEAEKSVTHAIEVDNSHFKLRLALARAYMDNGDFNNAVNQVSKVAHIGISRGEGPLIEAELKSILRLSPEHIPALMELVKYYNSANEPHNVPTYLEKIGTIFVRNEQLEEAAKIYLELIHLEPNDPSHRESLLSLKEHGVELEIPPLPSPGASNWDAGPGNRLAMSPAENLITEGDLFASYGQFQQAIDHFRRALEVDPHNVEAHHKILEICDRMGDYQLAAEVCMNLYSLYASQGKEDEAAGYYERASRYNPDIHHAPSSPRGQAPVDRGISQAAENRAHLSGLLEEVDFYLDQNFLAEARRCLRQCQEIASGDVEVERRAQRLSSLSRRVDAPVEAAPEPSHAPDWKQEPAVEGLETNSPSTPVIAADEISQLPGLETHPHAAHPPAPPPPSAPTEDETSFADLMGDLEGELAGTVTPEEVVPAPSDLKATAAGEIDGLHEVFAEFKAEFEEDEAESSDFDSHYNLGIAYKEMGLMEEAIGEFQKALKDKALEESSENFLRCCNMLGLCFLEQQIPQVAAKWFKRGLSTPGLPEDAYLALRYDLGCAQELSGDLKAAMETFLDIYGANINYRDVSEKIERLKQQP
jgi:tetratricopeptide (TPR) repeat protein